MCMSTEINNGAQSLLTADVGGGDALESARTQPVDAVAHGRLAAWAVAAARAAAVDRRQWRQKAAVDRRDGRADNAAATWK